MALSAGRLRHRVDIQERVETQDPVTGGVVLVWQDVWTSVPAAIEPLSAREFIAAQAVHSQITARIVMRHREDLKASMRIIHKGRIYNPAGFLSDPVSGLEYVTIPVTEGANDGK